MNPPAKSTVDSATELVGFAAAVRRAGVAAGPERVHLLAAAVDALGPESLYWAGRLTLCGHAEDIARYDRAYRGWLTGRAAPASSVHMRQSRAVVVPLGVGEEARTGVDETTATPAVARASRQELLRHRDLATLSTVERDEVRRLVALLRPAAPARPSRRFRAAARGVIDPRRSLAALRRALGEPARLRHRRRRTRDRRLVLLIDISGSMALYAESLLRFGHAATVCRPASTEVFTMGTRLTRVTRAMRRRDPDTALAQAGATIPDWRGGTRLGDTLDAFTRRYGHPGMARRAVLVVCSDGWERGDVSTLRDAMARLRRLAATVVWVSPHRGRPGFTPTVAGLAAVLPYLDHLVAGHTLDALEALADLLCTKVAHA